MTDRELNWQDCRDAATDAAANLAHCFNSIETPELTGRHREIWVESMVQREINAARQRGIRHFQAEADEPVPVTGDQFA